MQGYFKILTNYSVANIAGSINKIVTPDGKVVNNETHINDFVKNSERQFYEALKNHIQEVTKSVPSKGCNYKLF